MKQSQPDSALSGAASTPSLELEKEEKAQLFGLIDEYGYLRSEQRFDRAEALMLIIKAQVDALLAVRQSPPVEPSPWQPIETAPKNTRVLLYVPFEQGTTYAVRLGVFDDQWRDYWKYEGENGIYSEAHQPTHWMPLPSPPVPVEDTKNDHGAGLIHQVASPLAETESRPDLEHEIAEALRTNCLDHYAHKLAMAEIRKVLKRRCPDED